MTTGHQKLPVEVDPFRLAREGLTLETVVSQAKMKRLSKLLHSAENEVAVELEFGVDILGTHFLQGHLQTQVELICQRCLEPMQVDIDTTLSLGFVRHAAKAEMVPEGYEPIIAEDSSVVLLDLIEDELLLALPQIPMHQQQACSVQVWRSEPEQADENVSEVKAVNPFSVLAGLKKSDSE